MGARIIRWICFGVISWLLLVGIGMAGEKELTAIWEQEICDDLDGWIIQAAEADTGPWTQEFDVDYTGGASGEYSAEMVFISPDGMKKIWYFRICAYDNAGNSSVWVMANEPIEIDFENPPEPTIGTFRLTIKVVPGTGTLKK